MKKISNSLLAALAVSFLIAGLAGCEKQGPAEKAGESIDNAAASAGDHIEEAGEDIQDAAKDAQN
jgi:hypothetical protein